jgi:hypothetical protein
LPQATSLKREVLFQIIDWGKRSEPQHERLNKEAQTPGHGERMIFTPVKFTAP